MSAPHTAGTVFHLGDRVADFALEAPLPDRAALEAHVRGCASCAAEVAVARAGFTLLARALARPVPSPESRTRLEAALRPADRFAPLLDAVARFFDLGAARARELLEEIGDLARWEKSPLPQISLFHLAAGPAVAGADAGFVRVTAGATVGWHDHLGEERVLILQGSCVDDDGVRYRRGDGWIKQPGTRHTFTVTSREDLIHGLVLWEGVQFDGIPKIGGNGGPPR